MTGHDEFLRRVRGLVDSLGGVLSNSERAEVTHLIDHDEIAEALRTLAWIIVEEEKRIPRAAYHAIRELSDGLVTEDHMPRNLAAHVANE